jgi:hypothetical protein
MSRKQSEKVRNALKTLEVSRRFSQDKMTYGLERVDRYVEDVEGDWLEKWAEDNLVDRFTDGTTKVENL